MSSAPPITPIDLSVFAEIIDNARTDNNSGVVATISRDGPDVGFKGSLFVWDKDHVAWWERTLRETYAAIQNDPRVCVLVRNPTRDRRTIRLYGKATIVDDAELRERIWDRVVQLEKDTDKEKKGAAVLVRVDRVRAGVDTIQQRV
ncbi:MAG: pyridoxamine 5'-phosphate oxidase family protein [Chloroflexota bacterium]